MREPLGAFTMQGTAGTDQKKRNTPCGVIKPSRDFPESNGQRDLAARGKGEAEDRSGFLRETRPSQANNAFKRGRGRVAKH